MSDDDEPIKDSNASAALIDPQHVVPESLRRDPHIWEAEKDPYHPTPESIDNPEMYFPTHADFVDVYQKEKDEK